MQGDAVRVGLSNVDPVRNLHVCSRICGPWKAFWCITHTRHLVHNKLQAQTGPAPCCRCVVDIAVTKRLCKGSVFVLSSCKHAQYCYNKSQYPRLPPPSSTPVQQQIHRYIDTLAKEAMVNDTRGKIQSLIAARDAVEAQVAQHTTGLQQMGIGMQESLVDREVGVYQSELGTVTITPCPSCSILTPPPGIPPSRHRRSSCTHPPQPHSQYGGCFSATQHKRAPPVSLPQHSVDQRPQGTHTAD